MQHDTRASTRTTLVATSLVALLAVGCQNDQAARVDPSRADQKDRSAANTPSATAATQPPTPTVDEVREAPKQFYGKKVRLSGEVDAILTDRAFELEGAGWAFHDNITVFTKSAVQMSGALLAKGDEVVVTGTVQPFVTADIERDVGWDIAQETEIKLKERPVLIADSIRKVSESGRWTAEGVAQPIATVVALITTIDVSALVGQQVDLGRERVLAVTSKGMWVGPSTMSQVFVLPTTPPTNIKPGDTVQVSGTLRKVPANAGEAWDLPPALASAAREGTIFVDDATVRPAEGATAQATPE